MCGDYRVVDEQDGISSVEKIVGHKEVMETLLPRRSVAQRRKLEATTAAARVEAIRQAPPRPVDLMLMFWQHGTQWAEADWRSAQAYIAHFRPATTFTPSDGFTVRHVVIVGGEAGVSGQECPLSTAGVDVHRLAGANEAQTKAMLDALVAANTPWPGAPPASPRSPSENGPPIENANRAGRMDRAR